MEDREQIESMLMSLLDEIHVEETREFVRPRRQQASQESQQHQPQHQQQQLEVINDLLISYNNNIRDYQRNISMLASIIYLQNSTRQTTSSRPSSSRPTTSSRQSTTRQRNTTANPSTPLRETSQRNIPSSFEYYVQPNNQERVYYTSNIWRNFPTMTTSTTTAPGPLTSTEFENGTRSFVFSEENQSEVGDAVCPISLEPHQYGDTLCEITGCHHLFNKANLVNWFRRSHLCPVCRYNVRTNAPQPTSPPASTNNAMFREDPVDLARPLQIDTFYSDILRSLHGVTMQNNEENQRNESNEGDIPDNVSVD